MSINSQLLGFKSADQVDLSICHWALWLDKELTNQIKSGHLLIIATEKSKLIAVLLISLHSTMLCILSKTQDFHLEDPEDAPERALIKQRSNQGWLISLEINLLIFFRSK